MKIKHPTMTVNLVISSTLMILYSFLMQDILDDTTSIETASLRYYNHKILYNVLQRVNPV